MLNQPTRIVLLVVLLLGVLFALYLAYSRPGYFSDQLLLGAFIFLQILVAAVAKYRNYFFPLLMVAFLWAGMNLPFSGLWTSGRWLVLGAGAVVGFMIFVRERHRGFSAFHLVALLCVLAACVSALVSQAPQVTFLKALSLALLFLYGSAGARLAIVGREEKFFAGLLLGCEVLVYATAAAYLVFGLKFWGNPNSMGAVTGVVVAPLLLWSVLVSGTGLARSRRICALLLGLFLLLLSNSRAGIIAAAVSSTLLCLALRRYRLFAKGAAGAVFLVAITAILAPTHLEQFTSSSTSALLYKGHREGGLLGSRKTPWQETVSVIQEHPWFGSGFGTSASGREAGPSVWKYSSTQETNREHGSSYLAITEWVGLLGFLPFALLLLLLVGKLRRVLVWVRRTGNAAHPAVPLAMVVTAGLVHAVFEDWLFAVGYYLCVFSWTLAFALVDLAPNPVPALVQPVGRWPGTVLPHGSGVVVPN